jgi:tetratricopeptide (TPR) repeat protein
MVTMRVLPSRLSFFVFLACALPGFTRAADNWVEVRSPHFTVSSNAGEKQARRIANQFEEIRVIFHTEFATLRVDPGKPLLVIAVKNEDSMKVFLPDYWISKDRSRPAGMFVPGFDRMFAMLRTDVTGSGENPYHSLYHEYTHAILRLNFRSLPLWLEEGLAEFYGNTSVESSEVGLGRVSSMELRTLQRSQLIPIDTLMKVDQRSPLYNEKDRVSVFYAESWALVHYLMMDPDARKSQLLGRYLKALDTTDDAEEAGHQAFGDLKKFETRIDDYARQPGFYFQKIKPQTQFSEKDYTAREMTPAEVLTLEADFLEHTGHAKEVKPMLTQASGMQPGLAEAMSCMGYFDYLQYDNEAAEREFTQATQLNPKDFRAYYYLAQIRYRKNGYGEASTPEIVTNLEKVTQINPDFAPAYAFLSVAYLQRKETKEKAVGAALQAVKLDPTALVYVVDLGSALIALNRDTDAKAAGAQLDKAARTPGEKAMAQNFDKRLVRRQEYLAKKQGAAGGGADSNAEKSVSTDDNMESAATSGTETSVIPPAAGAAEISSEEGVIREARCEGTSRAAVKFAILGETLSLSAPDTAKIEFRSSGKDSTAGGNPCAQWNGRKAKITYKTSPDGKMGGEITAIEFF